LYKNHYFKLYVLLGLGGSMTDESGGPGGKPASNMLTDQLVQKIGQQILDHLASAGFASAELGRLAYAFAGIEDPRIRHECLSLIQAISVSPYP
jgi:hypothetical protein